MYTLQQYYSEHNYQKIFQYYSEYDFDLRSENLKILLYALFETNNMGGFEIIVDEYWGKIDINSDISRLLGYRGLLMFIMGDYKEALTFLEKAKAVEGEYSKEAADWITNLELDRFEYEKMENINFHFEIGIIKEKKEKFIEKYKKAYIRINDFVVSSEHHKNIDVYIFSGRVDKLGNRLSYSIPKFYTIHTNINDESGHELAHVVIENRFNIKCSFIKEGIAEYFDNSGREYCIDDDILNLSCMSLWNAFDTYKKENAYLYAKLFFSNLVETHSYKSCELVRIIEADTFEEAQSIDTSFWNSIDNKIRKNIYSMINSTTDRENYRVKFRRDDDV